MTCELCPRRCGVDRAHGVGLCGCGMLPRVGRIAPHYDEEPLISGRNGAGTVFFSGCSLRCVYCQNFELSSSHRGVEITPYRLSEEYRRLEAAGVHNIELVTPTHFVDAILESFRHYRPAIPIIYNSSGYESVETLSRLEGYIDVYLPDMKYSDNALSSRLSSCIDYVERASDAIAEMIRQRGEPVIEDGLIKSGVMIRHLVLPNHVNNSIGVLELIAERFPTALVSVMSQYIPMGRAEEFPDINRPITAREYDRVLQRLYELGLDGYAQERCSADKRYVPCWDYQAE